MTFAFRLQGANEPRPARDPVTRAGMPIDLIDEDRFCDLFAENWVCVDFGPMTVPESFFAI